MIDRLHRVLDKIEQLSPEIQEVAAKQLEALAEPFVQKTVASPARRNFAGIWSDLPDDMEEVLDHMRHEAVPTPPIADEDL